MMVSYLVLRRLSAGTLYRCGFWGEFARYSFRISCGTLVAFAPAAWEGKHFAFVFFWQGSLQNHAIMFAAYTVRFFAGNGPLTAVVLSRAAGIGNEFPQVCIPQWSSVRFMGNSKQFCSPRLDKPSGLGGGCGAFSSGLSFMATIVAFVGSCSGITRRFNADAVPASPFIFLLLSSFYSSLML
jgi:hypothetical protein